VVLAKDRTAVCRWDKSSFPRGGGRRDTWRMLTVFGACAVTFMMLTYALERRHSAFILAFACGCVLSSLYGFLAGTWPFDVVEVVWAFVAVNRYRVVRGNAVTV
jgi:hypothetical protein